MMIVCFIRSDDTEGWNNKCSNPVPVPVSQVSQEQRLSHSSSGSCSALAHPLRAGSGRAGSSAWDGLLTSQHSPCPPTLPALNKTASPGPLLE